MARRLSAKAASGGLRELLIEKRERDLQRWPLTGKQDDWLEDLRAHVPVTVSSAQVLHALSGARLPCDRFAYGGSEWGKFFVLDAGGELREVAG